MEVCIALYQAILSQLRQVLLVTPQVTSPFLLSSRLTVVESVKD